MTDPTSSSPAAAALADRLAHPEPLRRGSLSERFVKCSKPGCPCATDPDARHGPYLSLTRAVGGKTKSRYISPPQAAVARRQIAAGQQFRQQVDAYWKICEQWADEELDDLAAAPATAEAIKKGGSKRASKPPFSKRSKN